MSRNWSSRFCQKKKASLCYSICFPIGAYDFPINREIFLHKRTCETSHKYNHVGKKDTQQRRGNKILSRSQKALPLKSLSIIRSFLPQCENYFPLKNARCQFDCLFNVDFYVWAFFVQRKSAFLHHSSVFLCFLSLVQFRAAKNFMCWKKKAKENVGYLFSKSVGVYFSLLLDDFALLNRVFKVKIVFFFSESFIIFHYYSFFVVACWLLFSFRGTYIKLCVLYTVHEWIGVFFSKKYFRLFIQFSNFVRGCRVSFGLSRIFQFSLFSQCNIKVSYH